MNHSEHLLSIIAEEAAEVAQRATKTLRFGVAEVQPGQDHTNVFRLMGELHDLLAAVEMLHEHHGWPVLIHRDLIDAKKVKVEKFLAYSAKLGTLTPGVPTPQCPDCGGEGEVCTGQDSVGGEVYDRCDKCDGKGTPGVAPAAPPDKQAAIDEAVNALATVHLDHIGGTHAEVGRCWKAAAALYPYTSSAARASGVLASAPRDDDHVLFGGAIRIPKDSRKGKEPCGECYIQPGETCDRCGASGVLVPDQQVKPPAGIDATTARAFEIADEAMFEYLHSYGVTGHKDQDVVGFCADGHGEVFTLAEASDELREAVEWLAPRGYVRVEKDERGEFVRVLREPGDQDTSPGEPT